MEKEKYYQDYLEIIKLSRQYLEKRRKKRNGEEILSLEKLFQTVKNCQKCPLYKSRTHLVFGKGNPKTKLMLIGEAPGREEDLRGEPFVGAAGKLLTTLLNEVGIKREEIYITNILKCRPPRNRDPLPEEIKACIPILQAQIQIISPRIICTLGKFATQTLLNTEEGIAKLRGKLLKFKEGILLIPTFHPAACIYHQGWRKSLLGDLKMVKEELDKTVKKSIVNYEE